MNDLTACRSPHSLEAEISVLGALLIESQGIRKVEGLLDETMFYRKANRNIYAAMLRLHRIGSVIDVITLHEDLKRHDKLEASGGLRYLAEIVDAVPTAANIEHHAGIIREKALLRRLVGSCTKIISSTSEPGDRSASDLLAQAKQELLVLGRETPRGGFDGPPKPFQDAIAKPERVPIGRLPAKLGEFVESLATALQVHPDMVTGTALAAIAGACRGAFDVEFRGHRELVVLYVVTIARSGERKSACHQRLTGPHRSWEIDQSSRFRPLLANAHDRRDKLKRVHSKLVNSEANDDEIEAARLALDAVKDPPAPHFIVDGATPEALALVAQANGLGGVFITSAEGDGLGEILGDYADTLRAGIFKAGYTGESFRRARVGRDEVYIPRVACNVAVFTQPDAFQNQARRRQQDSQGVTARCVLITPESLIGSRKTGADKPTMDPNLAEDWERLIKTLLSEPPEVDTDGVVLPRVIRLTPEAVAAADAEEARIEAGLRPGGWLDSIPAGWAHKLFGLELRIAAILAIARAVEAFRGGLPTVGLDDMEAAIEIGRALASHAAVALGSMGEVEDARALWEVIRRVASDGETPTVRDVFTVLNKRQAFRRMADIEHAIGTLENLGYIRLIAQQSRGGRNPSPKIAVNPLAPGQKGQKRQTWSVPRPSVPFAPPSRPFDVFGEGSR